MPFEICNPFFFFHHTRIHFWLSYACCDLSSWALILVSSARLASILRPMSRFITNRRAYAAILLVCVLALCVNLPIFFMYGNVFIPSRGITKHCVIAQKSYRYFIVYVWTWIVLFKFAVVPGTILLGLNIVLIMHVYRSKRIIQDMQRGSFTKNASSSNNNGGRSNTGQGDGGRGGVACTSCCGCRSKKLPLGNGIHQLGRGLATKVSFSRWRRKAVVLAKEAHYDSNRVGVKMEDTRSTSPMLCKGTEGSVNLDQSYKAANGGVNMSSAEHNRTSQLTNKPADLQPAKSCDRFKTEAQNQDGDELCNPSRISGATGRVNESENLPLKTLSLHESYADIKQLRDAVLWNNIHTSVSVQDSILFLNHNIQKIHQGNKFKSCSDIPRTVFVKDGTNRGAFARPRFLSGLKQKVNTRDSGSVGFGESQESSCDVFFTDHGLELAPDSISAQNLSRATTHDQIVYDDLKSDFELHRSSQQKDFTRSYPGGDEDRSVEAYDDREISAFISEDDVDESEESSSEEFFSCADDTKFSPLLKNKSGNHFIKHESKHSQLAFMYPHVDNTCSPVQAVDISEKNRPKLASSTQNGSINTHIRYPFEQSSKFQNVNVIVNDLASFTDEEYEAIAHNKRQLLLIHEGPKNGASPKHSPRFPRDAGDGSLTEGEGNHCSGHLILDVAEAGSNVCLRVVNGNICDINVTRCSSAADIISLNDRTHDQTQDATTTPTAAAAAATATNHRDNTIDTAIAQSGTDKAQTAKSANLCVERKPSANKRDRMTSLADLNLSLSSLGKTSLASGATDISSFTIAAPSAFTSAENLTVAAEPRRRSADHRKSSADQHAVTCPRSGPKTRQKKQGQSSRSMFPKSSARPKNLTRTLLVINSVFLVCNIPIVIYMTGKVRVGYYRRGNQTSSIVFEFWSNSFIIATPFGIWEIRKFGTFLVYLKIPFKA